ncbi:MAG: phosphoenolpyruvate carboxylase, partial [Acidobacteriota bacterium]
SLLEKELEMAKVLVRRLDPTFTPDEERAALALIRDQITTAWQTADQPNVRPTVGDERDHVLYHLTDVIYRVVPPLYEDLGRALVEVYGDEARGVELPEILRCGSWVGGDMDGNPFVTADTLRETLVEHRRQILHVYRREVAELARHLSQTRSRIAVDPDIEATIERYGEQLPDALDAVPPRHRDMPYRILLRLMRERLKRVDGDRPGGYDSADGLLADLDRIADSLRGHRGAHAGLHAIERLRRRVATFGFHLATVDVRQDAEVHRRVVGRLLGDPTWPERPADERREQLVDTLATATERTVDADADDEEAHRTLAVFRTITDARSSGPGPRAIGPYIISMAQGADDVLSVLLLARWAGLVEDDGDVPLDVAPLFETVEDLRAAPAIMDGLLADPLYRHHLARRGDRQMVMVGYSDSNKDGGLIAARWALHRAQTALAEVFDRHGIELVLFHGRGGTISRGGGRVPRAVLAAPRGTVRGHLRLTEQGEVIAEKYGLRGIALRTMETTLGAVLRASGETRDEDPREARWREMVDVIARTGRARYRALVYDDARFYGYFREATPIDAIERLMIGSRPAKRRAQTGIENLRAIPWVFSWVQNRHYLPGWYGLGSALEQAIETFGRDAVAEMARDWSFVGALLTDVEMVLAKADLRIGERYAALAEDGGALFPVLRAEYHRTVEIVLDLQGRRGLLDAEPTLQRSIRLRNPYVDPMSLLQIDLLRRWRAGDRQDDGLLAGLLASVQGVAEGLRSTG